MLGSNQRITESKSVALPAWLIPNKEEVISPPLLLLIMRGPDCSGDSDADARD